MTIISFADLGASALIVERLADAGITSPTPIQAKTVPDMLAGHNIVAGAPTGSGKTLAFGIPLLTNLVRGTSRRPAAIILTPTRELAAQIHSVLDDLAGATGGTVFAVYGGVAMGPQRSALNRGLDILVATPGRLEDLMQQGAVSLDNVQVLVIDEADRMADVGFLPAVRRVLKATPKRRQTVLFSATTGPTVTSLVRDHIPNAKRHSVEATQVDQSRTTHLFWNVNAGNRGSLCAEIIRRSGRTIVFTRTKRGADRLALQLSGLGVKVAAMHGNRSQAQRERALADLNDGRIAVLVATDVAARGIHVDDVGAVVHFDPPEVATDFTHRSGRTARAGATGLVVSFVPPEKRRDVRQLQKDAGRTEAITDPDMELVPVLPPVVAVNRPAPQPRLHQEHLTERPQRSGNHRGGGRRGGPSSPQAPGGTRSGRGARPGPQRSSRAR